MNNMLNQTGEVLEETLAGSNSDAVKTTLGGLRYFKMTLPHFAILYSREYCEWFGRLRCHIQTGRCQFKLPSGLETQSFV